MRNPRRSCTQWTELEQRISILELKIDSLPSKTDELHETSHEGTTTAEAITGNMENAPQLVDMIAVGAAECIDLTKQNVSTARWHKEGARPKKQNIRVSVKNHKRNYRTVIPFMVQKLQNRFECLRDLEVEPPREQVYLRQRPNHKKKVVGQGEKQHSTYVHPSTLVIDDSTVRNLKRERMIVCCLPNASISEITKAFRDSIRTQNY